MNKTEYCYIDLQTLKKNTFGNAKNLKLILEVIVKNIDDYVAVLNQELPNKNWQTLYQATHKIKPSINMVGVAVLAPTIQQLEDNFKNKQNLDKMESLVKISLDIFKQVKIELHNELKSLENG